MDLAGEGRRSSSLSFLQLSKNLSGQSAPGFGVVLLTLMLVVCTVAVPLLQAVVWAIVWSFPLRSRILQRLMSISEILSSWSFLEVFMLGVFITALQMEKIAYGLVDTLESQLGSARFNIIQQMLGILKTAGLLKASDTELFTLTADLRAAAYTMLAASIILNCAGIFITRRAAAVLKFQQRSLCELTIEA